MIQLLKHICPPNSPYSYQYSATFSSWRVLLHPLLPKCRAWARKGKRVQCTNGHRVTLGENISTKGIFIPRYRRWPIGSKFLEIGKQKLERNREDICISKDKQSVNYLHVIHVSTWILRLSSLTKSLYWGIAAANPCLARITLSNCLMSYYLIGFRAARLLFSRLRLEVPNWVPGERFGGECKPITHFGPKRIQRIRSMSTCPGRETRHVWRNMLPN